MTNTLMTEDNIRASISDDTKRAVSELCRPQKYRSIWLYIQVYFAIFVIVSTAIYLDNIYVTLSAIVLIAGRQHSLYILNHDASHYGLFKSKKANKRVASVLSNLTMLHHHEAWSFVQWRRIHMLHHKHLFTDNDPNYLGRKNQGDTLASPSLLKLARSVVSAGLFSIVDFIFSKQSYARPKDYQVCESKYRHLHRLFVGYKDDVEMERERIVKLLFFSSTIALVLLLDITYEFFIYWVLPMHTVYPMILRFNDLTEHRWELATSSIVDNTRSRADGILAKVFVSGFPRGFHREHHIFPRAGVVDLPKVNALLVKDGLVPKPINGLYSFFCKLRQLNKESIRT